MASNIKKDAEWAEAKKKCRLNDETLKMAREMGLNPRSLIKNIPSPSQQWKTILAMSKNGPSFGRIQEKMTAKGR
ncbi:MAG: hypothetical protein ACYDEJ_15240 [Desulfitobacteriaceae bacterium]